MIEKRVAGVLLSGAAFLLVEVRFEHREVLGETWRGWIPLAWAALVIAAGVPAWLAWTRGGRKLLTVLPGRDDQDKRIAPPLREQRDSQLLTVGKRQLAVFYRKTGRLASPGE